MCRRYGGLIVLAILVGHSGALFAADWDPLPDTGQTKCYDSTGSEIPCPSEGQALYGQDGNYLGPTPYYRGNGDGTVTDMHTTLMWQQGGSYGLNWDDAILYCTNLELAEFDDWRLPERMELKSIIDYSRLGPACPPLITCSQQYGTPFFYWTATEVAANSSQAWGINFYRGEDCLHDKSWINYSNVKCVRGGL